MPCSHHTHILWLSVWHFNESKTKLKTLLKPETRICLGEVNIDLIKPIINGHDLKYTLQKPRPAIGTSNSEENAIICVKLKFVPKSNPDDQFRQTLVKKLSRMKSRSIEKDTIGSLEVRVAYGKDLPVRRSGKPPNPYCKSVLYIVEEDCRFNCLSKQRTPTESSTCDPKWNHTMIYHNFTLDHLKYCLLEISVWDDRLRKSKVCLGRVRIFSNSSLNPVESAQSSREPQEGLMSINRAEELWSKLTSGSCTTWVSCLLYLKRLPKSRYHIFTNSIATV